MLKVLGKESARKSLSAALKTVRKPKAQEALKSYHGMRICSSSRGNPGGVGLNSFESFCSPYPFR